VPICVNYFNEQNVQVSQTFFVHKQRYFFDFCLTTQICHPCSSTSHYRVNNLPTWTSPLLLTPESKWTYDELNWNYDLWPNMFL